MKIQPLDLLKKGGPWLGEAREYLLWHVKGGDSCTWGSEEPLTLTVRQIEELAAHVAAAVMNQTDEN